MWCSTAEEASCRVLSNETKVCLVERGTWNVVDPTRLSKIAQLTWRSWSDWHSLTRLPMLCFSYRSTVSSVSGGSLLWRIQWSEGSGTKARSVAPHLGPRMTQIMDQSAWRYSLFVSRLFTCLNGSFPLPILHPLPGPPTSPWCSPIGPWSVLIAIAIGISPPPSPSPLVPLLWLLCCCRSRRNSSPFAYTSGPDNHHVIVRRPWPSLQRLFLMYEHAATVDIYTRLPTSLRPHTATNGDVNHQRTCPR